MHPVACSLSVARRDIYGPHDPLEDLVNSWIDHLRAVAGKHRWSYDNDVALLDDMALARIACVEATMLPLQILLRDFPAFTRGKVTRSRMGCTVLSTGRQGHEGGNVKAKDTSGDGGADDGNGSDHDEEVDEVGKEVDVNGPNHFALVGVESRKVLNKYDDLQQHRACEPVHATLSNPPEPHLTATNPA